MALDTEHFKTVLQAKEQELIDETSNLDETARQSRVAEVEDPVDQVQSDEGKAAAFNISTITADMLSAVRGALQRIEAGEYGVCVDCERPIELKRLEAVPWTPYCLQDQEKHDEQNKQDLAASGSVL